jgi:magnesium-transporting ATPase (P-type)
MNEPATLDVATVPFLRRAFDWWLTQLRHVLAPTIFFFVGFNLILWTKHLILSEHGIDFSGFITATLAALLVGKAVLVTDNLSLMHRFDGAPLIQPILFKTAIYWLCLLVVRLVEVLIHFLADGGAFNDFPPFLVERFSWPRFLSIQIWLMVLFFVYVTGHELNTLFGDGELRRLFFRWRSSEAKLNRRRRIRLLFELNRLTEANSIEAISERGSHSYTKLVAILHELASPQTVGSSAR